MNNDRRGTSANVRALWRRRLQGRRNIPAGAATPLFRGGDDPLSQRGLFLCVRVCLGLPGQPTACSCTGPGWAGPPHPELLCIAELTDYLRISRAAVRVGYVRRHKRTPLITERLLLYAAAIFINVHFPSAVRVNTHPPV